MQPRRGQEEGDGVWGLGGQSGASWGRHREKRDMEIMARTAKLLQTPWSAPPQILENVPCQWGYCLAKAFQELPLDHPHTTKAVRGRGSDPVLERVTRRSDMASGAEAGQGGAAKEEGPPLLHTCIPLTTAEPPRAPECLL